LFSADPKKFEQLTGRLNKARADLEKAEEDWLEIEALKEEIAAKG
jgi:ATP-binding cassette subfamily F protein uup